MAAGAFTFFNSFREFVGDGTIDLDTHTFKLQLHSSSYVPDLNADLVRADLSNELATANGYTAGGQALAGVTWTKSTVTVTFDANDVVWTASGGSITARYGVLYDDTAANDELVGYFLLDAAPADVTATDGNTLTVAWNASGIFTLT